MKHLITQTLLSSWLYTFDCAEGHEEDARADFLRTLNREPSEPNEAIRNGIEFENGVYALAADPKSQNVKPEWRNVSQRIADILRGGQLQVRGSCTVNVDGEEILLYGIADGMKAGVIYDVKKKAKGFGSLDLPGSYLTSPQHPAYFRIFPGAYRFVYLVSDGQELYTETYERQKTAPIEDIIRNFLGWLRAFGLYETYVEKWETLK